MVAGGRVDEPAHTIGVVVNFEGASAGLSGRVKVGELTGGEIGDLEGNFWRNIWVKYVRPDIG